ncbi:hypothetical protein ACFC0S_19700 [Streptomyces sp. NPDC056084]|uniref:hypothetical protein n=1 Tax=unclassified Streptomyces TaxID=2593676 RepID=UPI0035D6739F
MRHKLFRLAVISAVCAATLPVSAAANAADAPSNAVSSAEIVEKVTGTQDLAPADTGTRGATQAVTDGPDGQVVITAPQQSTGMVEGTVGEGSTFRLGLPSTKDVTGVRSAAGTVVYTDAAASTDIAVQPITGGGARSLLVLKDRNAPTVHRFELDLPSGTEAVANQDGGYDLVRNAGDDAGVTVGAIDAAWAKDANGNDVPTSYTLDGTTLVQEIKITSETTFPVVADPSVSFGRGVYVKFNQSETKSIAPYADAAKAVVAACQKVPSTVRGVPVRTICRGTLGTSASSVKKTFQSAASQNKCVQIRLPYAPIGVVIGWPEWKSVTC